MPYSAQKKRKRKRRPYNGRRSAGLLLRWSPPGLYGRPRYFNWDAPSRQRRLMLRDVMLHDLAERLAKEAAEARGLYAPETVTLTRQEYERLTTIVAAVDALPKAQRDELLVRRKKLLRKQRDRERAGVKAEKLQYLKLRLQRRTPVWPGMLDVDRRLNAGERSFQKKVSRL